MAPLLLSSGLAIIDVIFVVFILLEQVLLIKLKHLVHVFLLPVCLKNVFVVTFLNEFLQVFSL